MKTIQPSPMKSRRKRLSRSTIRKYSAELEQRLTEQSKLERLERLSQVKDGLVSSFLLLLLIVFLIAIRVFFDLMFKNLQSFTCLRCTPIEVTLVNLITVLMSGVLAFIAFKLYVEDKKKRSNKSYINSSLSDSDHDYSEGDDRDHWKSYYNGSMYDTTSDPGTYII